MVFLTLFITFFFWENECCQKSLWDAIISRIQLKWLPIRKFFGQVFLGDLKWHFWPSKWINFKNGRYWVYFIGTNLEKPNEMSTNISIYSQFFGSDLKKHFWLSKELFLKKRTPPYTLYCANFEKSVEISTNMSNLGHVFWDDLKLCF